MMWVIGICVFAIALYLLDRWDEKRHEDSHGDDQDY